MRKIPLILLFVLVTLLLGFNLGFSLNKPAWVKDGTGEDIDYTNNNTSYSANWAAVDFSEATGFGGQIGYYYNLYYYDPLLHEFNLVEQGTVDATYPNIPNTRITKSYNLDDGRYFIRVRSFISKLDLISDWTDSDGFRVDTTPPSVTMQSLSSTQSSTSFSVSWSATDASGISYYDVQVKAGNGQWQSFLVHTSLTSTTFNGTNGQTYQFRARATDIVGNVSSYSAAVQTTVQATGVSLSLSASPSSLSFSTGEENKTVTLTVVATGPGSVNLTRILESRVNSETGTENLPPEIISGTVSSGTSFNVSKVVHLSTAQRAAILSTSSKSFSLSLTIEGTDSYGNPVSSSVTIPVQVTELPPPSLVINDVTITLPQSPYYIGDIIENAQVTINATGNGLVEGQVLIDDSTDWSDSPQFSVNVNNRTTFTINGNIPTTSAGDHTIKVEITSPVQFTKEKTYTVSDQTPPFPPQTLVLVKDVAVLKNLNGTAEATTVTGPNGYVEYNFTGTADMTLISLKNTEVKDVTVTNLIVRYDNSNPTKAKIRGGTVEKEVEDGYITDFADGTLRIKKVSFTGQKSPATDFIRVDAKLYWKKIGKELVDIGGFIVRTEGVEAKSVNIQESKPKTFNAFGLTFKLHNVDAKPALVFGKDEANDRYYFSMSGSISMKSKKGTTTKDETLTTFKGFSIYSDGDVTGTITITKKFDLIPNMVTLTKIKFQMENDNLKCKIKGNVHDLPAPLDDLPTTEFSIKFDKDGNVEGNITLLKELKKGNKGHGVGSNDSTEWDVGIGTIDITYLNLFIQYDEGTLNKDHSELQVGLDLYLNLKNQDGSNPTSDEKRISFGEINQNDDFTGGIRVNFDGDFTWNNPTNATIISNKKLDLTVITIMINALGVQSDPFAIVFSGSILFDIDSIEGGISFENLVVGLDGVISNLSDSITGGNLSIMEMVQVEVGDINWSMEETDLTFKENQTQGEGENQSPQTGDKTVRVENYFQLLNASMSIGDGEGSTIMSGGFKEFTIYKPVNGSRSFVLKEANLSVSEIELHADVEYSQDLLLFAGSLIMPGPEGNIEAIACGKFGVQNNKPTMGIFIAAAGLNIPIGPGVFLNEVGGGFFLNPIQEDILMVRNMAHFERPELNDSIEEMRPGGADNPGSYALMLLGGVYVSSPDVMNGRALATLTSNYFNLDAEVELTQGLLKGTAYFAIGWNPSYAEGAVDVKMNYIDLITGTGSLDFYAYGSDAWGVMGNFNVALLGQDLATGSVFVGNPGFMLEASVTSGVDLKIVSGSYTIGGMFWYYRTPDPDTFGAYGKVSAEGEFLEGLLSAKASLEGALMAVPSFVFYSVGSVKFKVCYVTVYKGSLWIAVSSSGFDGGKGRNEQYDGYIEEARNMANDLKNARDELEGELEQAKADLAKLNDEQRTAAGLALVERSGILGALVKDVFRQNEDMRWGSALPPKLQMIHAQLFGNKQQSLVHIRNELSELDKEIQNKIADINNFQPSVVDELKDYEELIVGELPSVREVGTLRDPFKGMQTKVVKDRNGHNITITIGFQIDENEAQSQRDKLNNLREDFAKYQDEFIKQAGIIDGSLQRLDEILFMNNGNLNQLVEKYAGTYHKMSEYINKYVAYLVANKNQAEWSLGYIQEGVTPEQIESIMEDKARELLNEGKEDELNYWIDRRLNLISVLVQAGGVEGYNPPENITSESDPIELFKITGREIWWEIPTRGFQASAEISEQRRTAAISTFKQNAFTFNQKWVAASNTIDKVYQKKADLYNLLYEIYDELATYGSGMIGILDSGNACGFGGMAGAGLGFRTKDMARSVGAQGYTPPGDVMVPNTPTMGPLRPPVKVNSGVSVPRIQTGASMKGVISFSNKNGSSDFGNDYISNYNDINDVYVQAGVADIQIAQVGKKLPKGTSVSSSSSKSTGVQTSISGIGQNILPEYKSFINRKIQAMVPKVPVKWVPINIYFAAKRAEIKPYIEIPKIINLSGNLISTTQYNAFLTATVTASHPIDVVEYSYKIAPVEENTQQAGMMLRNINNDEIAGLSLIRVNDPWYLEEGKLYAGGVPDAATETPSVPENMQQITSGSQGEISGINAAGIGLHLYMPWFSQGKINTIENAFFSSSDKEGEYYLYVKVRGAGGYSIERRAKVKLKYFDPNSDNAPVSASLDASDSTPPIKPIITIASKYTSNRHMLYARWYASDPESGIQRYEYGISSVRNLGNVGQEVQNVMGETVGSALQYVQEMTGTSQAKDTEYIPDVLPWTNAGGRTEANIRRINLQHGKKYKVWVRATNGVGLKSIGSSEEIMVDTTPPTQPEISVFERVDIGYYPNSLHFVFNPGEDKESGIDHNFFAIGTEQGSNNLFDWTEVTSTDIKIANLPISQGENIWLTIESYNKAGLKSTKSDSIVVNYNDTTPPEAATVVTFPVGFTSKTDSISIGWNIVYDSESGIVKYEYGLGTNAQSPNVVSWRVVGNVDRPVLLATGEQASKFEKEHQRSYEIKMGKSSFNSGKSIKIDNSSQATAMFIVSGGLSTDFVQKLDNLSMQSGKKYYGFVRVTNGAGLTSIAVSEPLTVDTTKPEVSIQAPSNVNLSLGWSLPIKVTAEDNDSGVYKYRYAVWRVDEQSKIDEIEKDIFAYAGVGDFDNSFIVASAKKQKATVKPQTEKIRVSPEGTQNGGNTYQGIIEQGSPVLEIEGIKPWEIEDTTPPWAQSPWIMVTSGVPPKQIEFNIKISDLPSPGLEGGNAYRVKVWVMNGAGLIGKSNSVIIHTIVVKKSVGVKIQPEAAEGMKSSTMSNNIPKQ